MKKLLIYIPSYNRGNTILRQLNTIKSNGCREHFDLIISDNCSTDKEYKEVENICEKEGFKYGYPYRHKIISSSLKKKLGNQKKILKQISQRISKRLNEESIQFKIISREKELFSTSGNNVDYYSVKGVSAVDFRSDNLTNFESLEKNSIDLYSSVKSIYLQDKKNKIKNSNADQDDWGNLDN